METKKSDRRVVRTRKAIREALMDLLVENDYRKITITALARKADIDRKTFYTHYASIGELMEDLVRTNAEMNLGDLGLKDFVERPHETVRHLLTSFDGSLIPMRKDRRKIIEHVPLDTMLRWWTITAKEHIMQEAGPLPKQTQEEIMIILDFYLGGITNALARWLVSGSDMPFEKVVDLISASIVDGVSGIMGHRMQTA